MQQATVNLFADMGVAADYADGWAAAAAIDRHTPPTSTITSPSAGANIQDGSRSTDLWVAPATAAAASSPAWKCRPTAARPGIPPRSPRLSADRELDLHGDRARYLSTTIESRAVDDSGNIETPSDGISVNVGCPCSLFGTSVTPATAVPLTRIRPTTPATARP